MKKYFLIALIISLIFSAVLFFIPINLFEGEILFKVNGIEFKEKAKISLSYFIGIGASPSETKDVLNFYLLPFGYLNVFLMLLAFPSLISYRIFLADQKKKTKTHN